MGAAEQGYPDANEFARSSLIWTHLPLLYPMWLAWRVKDEVPWLFLSLALCYVASTEYHLCYSYDVCVFRDRRLHRHCDHYFSLMVVPVVLTAFLFVRRCTPLIGIVKAMEKEPTPQKRVHYSNVDTGDVVTTVSVAPVYAHTTFVNDVYTKLSAPSDATMHVPYKHERPIELDAFILALYIINAYVHIAQGMNHYSSMTTLTIGALLVGGAHLGEALEHGLRLRFDVLVLVLIPALIANGVFMLDETFGAAGHSLWHVLGFISISIFLRFGPIFVDADGSHVVLGG